MSYKTPDNLLYTEEHEWIDTDTGWVGITDFAQDELGDIVFVDLPEVGSPVDADDPFMVIESVKAVSDVYSPATGEIADVNESLEDQPERVNDSPYDEGQIVRLSVSELPDSLLSPEEYESYIG